MDSVSWQRAISGLGVFAWEVRARTWTIVRVLSDEVRPLGYSRRTWRAKGFWLAHVYAADRAGLSALLDEVAIAPSESAVRTVDYRFIDGDGGVRWLRASLLPPERGGSSICVAHCDAPRDRGNLTHMHRLATLGELATSIAHELNQPLATIMASTSAVRRLLSEGIEREELGSILDEMSHATSRAAEIVRRAHAMVARDHSAFESISLNDIVSGAARLIASDLAIRQISLSTDLAPEPLSVVGDRIQLQQVLLNLFLNAMDAVDTQPQARRHVRVTTRRITSESVEVRVSDTGAGIAPGVHDRLFEPFFTSKATGTGLGLAIVQNIVRDHHGSVIAEPSSAGGAAFRVRLPSLAP